MRSCKFILLFATTFILSLSIVFLANFILDPNGQYLNKFYFYESYLADQLIKYKNIALSPGSYNDRKFIEFYTVKSKYKPNLIIVGSSVSQEISSEFLSTRLLNLSLAGSTIEDIIAISTLVLNENNYKINNIIIGIDYKMLTQDSEIISKYCSLKNIFPDVDKNLKINLGRDCDFQVNKITGIFSISLLKQSVGQIIKYLYHNTVGIPHDISAERLKKYYIINKDGSAVFDLVHHDNLAVNNFDRNYISSSHFISEFKLEQLRILINYLSSKEITTTVYLAPISPSLWSKRSNNYLLLNEKKIIAKLSKTPNTKIFGSFNPEAVNCSPKEFHDTGHAKLDCIKKALSKNNI